MTRFAILDESGKALNVVEFHAPIKEMVWPGYGRYWVCAEPISGVPKPDKVDPKMDLLDWAVRISPGDTLDLITGVVTPLVPDQPPPPSKQELRDYAAEKRWSVETGGSAWNGHVVRTDRDSQSKLIAEFVAIQAGIRPDPSRWKMQSGDFVSLSNGQMTDVILTARTHVAQAFEIEDLVLNDIEAGLITTFQDIEQANWPKGP